MSDRSDFPAPASSAMEQERGTRNVAVPESPALVASSSRRCFSGEFDVLADAMENLHLVNFLRQEGVVRGMEKAADHASYVEPFCELLFGKLEALAHKGKSDAQNGAKIIWGLRGFREVIRLAHVCYNGRSDVPVVAAFAPAKVYCRDHLHFYCDSAAFAMAYCEMKQDGTTMEECIARTEALRGIPREDLVSLYTSTITRAVSALIFPKPHGDADPDHGVVFSLTTEMPPTRIQRNPIPPKNGKKNRNRTRLAEPALTACWTALNGRYRVPPLDQECRDPRHESVNHKCKRGYTMKRKRDDDAADADAPPPKRHCEGAHADDAAAGKDDLASTDAAAPERHVAFNEADDAAAEAAFAALRGVVADAPIFVAFPEPRNTKRGPEEDAHALVKALLVSFKGIKGARLLAMFAFHDSGHTSDDSDTDDDAEVDGSRAYALPWGVPGLLSFHLRGAYPTTKWRDVNDRIIVFGPLQTEVCVTIRNPFTEHYMRAFVITWDKRGYTRLDLYQKGKQKGRSDVRRECVVCPGETYTMKDAIASFTVSAPEDDRPIDGFFMMFYQFFLESQADETIPEWLVAGHGYQLLPEDKA